MPHYADTDPHTAIVLLGPEGSDVCLSIWRDEPSAGRMEPEELLPLPDAAMDAAGDNFESAGIVTAVHRPDQLPAALRALLPEAPAPGCVMVVVARMLLPEVTEDGYVPLGGFDAPDARRLLALMEEHGVAFSVEADHSALMQPGRHVGLYLGLNPPGSQLQILVQAGDLGHARKLVRYIFPPEVVPASFRAVTSAQVPPGQPSMDVYAAPVSEIRVPAKQHFHAPVRDESRGE